VPLKHLDAPRPAAFEIHDRAQTVVEPQPNNDSG
jgi:hypothetical protein